jgi:hypothetical protein
LADSRKREYNSVTGGRGFGKSHAHNSNGWRHSEAEPLLRAALTEFEASQADKWQRFNCESLLGSSLLGQRKYEAAEPLLLKGYSGMAERQARIPALERANLVRSINSIIKLYRDWQKPDKATVWRGKLAATH